MFPKIEKSLIIELFNEMNFNDLLDILIQLDQEEEVKSENINSDLENQYSDNSLSLIGCENVPRRRESIMQTIRNRLNNNRRNVDSDLEGYVQLSQYDQDNK